MNPLTNITNVHQNRRPMSHLRSRKSSQSSRPKKLGNEYLNLMSSEMIVPPTISAKSWAIANGSSGITLFGKNENDRRQMASLTKIMTAYTTLCLVDKMDIDMKTTLLDVSRNSASVIGTRACLCYGDSLYLNDLLFGLLLPSGNDAAICLAEYFGRILYTTNNPTSISRPKFTGKYFVQEMNQNAKKLGLHSTTYANPHGLANHNNKSTASDIAKLVYYAMQNPTFQFVINTKEYSCEAYDIDNNQKTFNWTNTNKMLNIPGYNGVKTGITPPAGPCLASSYHKEDSNFIIILLNSKNMDIRWLETQRLVKWCQNRLKAEKSQDAVGKMFLKKYGKIYFP